MVPDFIVKYDVAVPPDANASLTSLAVRHWIEKALTPCPNETEYSVAARVRVFRVMLPTATWLKPTLAKAERETTRIAVMNNFFICCSFLRKDRGRRGAPGFPETPHSKEACLPMLLWFNPD